MDYAVVHGGNVAADPDPFPPHQRSVAQAAGGHPEAHDGQTRPGPSYFPWGEPRGTNPQDAWSYASYWTDSTTGLDYANNRYYANAYGRFMTPDPYKASGAPSDPQSWNRYTYTVGDPVNRLDATGLDYTLTCGEDSEDCGGFIDINQNVCITIDNVPNPLCGYPIYGFQGPGGGASGPKFGIAHKPGSNVGPAGYSGAIALLQNASAQCLKDLNAASANAATYSARNDH